MIDVKSEVKIIYWRQNDYKREQNNNEAVILRWNPIALLLLLAVVLDSMLPFICNLLSVEKIDYVYSAEGQRVADVVILGSSRANNHCSMMFESWKLLILEMSGSRFIWSLLWCWKLMMERKYHIKSCIGNRSESL
jgi:hypothetical protein